MCKDSSQKTKFGYQCPFLEWTTIMELGICAEKAGYDSLWMPDHMTGPNGGAVEAWTCLAALAMQTNRVKLGSMVSATYHHHPAVLAQMATTVDAISNGRVILGIGTGEAMNLDPYGIAWDHPLARTVDALKVVKKLWTEEVVNYEGNYFKLRNAFLHPKPLQKPHPPIYIAFSGPKAMAMAARFGDGWISTAISPKEYGEKLRNMTQLLKMAGRDPLQVEPTLPIQVAIARDYDKAREMIMLPAKLRLLTAPATLERLGYRVPTKEFDWTRRLLFHPGVLDAWIEKAKEIPDEIVEKSACVFGAPDDVIDKVEKWVEAGARHITTPFTFSTQLRRLEVMKEVCELFAEKVISYFRESL